MSRWRSELRLLGATLLVAGAACALPAAAHAERVGGSSRPLTASARPTLGSGSPIGGDARSTGGTNRAAAGSVRRVHGRARHGHAPRPHRPPAPAAEPVTATVHFGFNRARLRRQAVRVLDGLARQVGRRPGGARVTIHGYADAIGTDRYNLGLSARRALLVARELRKLLHLRRIPVIVPYGERHPIAHNTLPDGRDDPAGRALNRRVSSVIQGSRDFVSKSLQISKN